MTALSSIGGECVEDDKERQCCYPVADHVQHVHTVPSVRMIDCNTESSDINSGVSAARVEPQRCGTLLQ